VSRSRFDDLPAVAVNDQRRIPCQAVSKIPCLDMVGCVVIKNPAKVVFLSLLTQDLKFNVRVDVARQSRSEIVDLGLSLTQVCFYQ